MNNFVLLLVIFFGTVFLIIVLIGFFCAFALDMADKRALADGTPSVDEQLAEAGIRGLTSSGHYIEKDGSIR